VTETLAVRLGVLGAAAILETAVAEPAARVPEIRIEAIAARDRDRATQTASRFGIPRVLDDYDAVLADTDLDAVYVPTPAALHGAWTLRAIRAGKHVLCEKPLTANADEAAEIDAAARASGLVVMEAFHSRHHPLWDQVRRLLDDGAIGEVRTAEASFCVPILDRTDIRWQPDLGGGGLMDLGVYPLRLLQHVVGAGEVLDATATDEGGIDATMTVVLHLAGRTGGVRGTVRTSMVEEADPRASARFVGTDGTLDVHMPYHPQQGGRLTIERDGTSVEEPVDPTSTYEGMLRAFAGAVLRGQDVGTGTAEALSTMRLVDAAYRAAGMAPRRPLAPR
jgi:predicted dehydrogenase